MSFKNIIKQKRLAQSAPNEGGSPNGIMLQHNDSPRQFNIGNTYESTQNNTASVKKYIADVTQESLLKTIPILVTQSVTNAKNILSKTQPQLLNQIPDSKFAEIEKQITDIFIGYVNTKYITISSNDGSINANDARADGNPAT